MTRINVIPPKDLHYSHLVAEYRELPRLFKLAESYWNRDKRQPLPADYRLGKGHVLFFYNKLTFLKQRFELLVKEMITRGYKPAYTDAPMVSCPACAYNDYTPTNEAISINTQRIKERLDANR